MDELLDVTVSVANRGENSYNSRVILTYPAGLSYRKFTIQQIVAEVEDFTKAIIGGCLGGLAILAFLTAGLYKAGFFQSKYKQMIKESAEDAPGNDASALTAE
ncbi:integrin alpha-M-like [Oreochromis aureus]|uniref:integrin alpha-M-like n=1 Tax=Oreochromis aureus TaxID=47969 RepID=UPI00195312E0|nr:integrin alpha-M-like [Oreochromis aureus]XP_039472560.1 integrin alpha-M-like [Oreochromis aureus]